MSDTPHFTPASSRPDDDAPPDWEALARFQAGESPEAEARSIAAWLTAHPGDAQLLASLDAVLARVTSAPAAGVDGAVGDVDVDVETALRRVRARRDAEPAPAVTAHIAAHGGDGVLPLRRRLTPAERVATLPPTRSLVRRFLGVGLAAAAAIAAVAVALSRRADSVHLVAAGAPGSVVTTAVGVRDSVRLPDGTRVVLAPGSRLAVAAEYASDQRAVTLDGAALFTVRHDAAHPFAVRAGGAMVVDVGTTFVVRTDGVDEAGGVAVAVTEGAVRLVRVGEGGLVPDTVVADSGIRLAAGDRGELRADGRVVAMRGAAGDDDVAWARGRLTYEDAPLDVVRADLRRWYGVDLRVADSALARRRLTASFESDSAARVLDVVALALGATVERNGNVAVLRRATPGRGAAAPR